MNYPKYLLVLNSRDESEFLLIFLTQSTIGMMHRVYGNRLPSDFVPVVSYRGAGACLLPVVLPKRMRNDEMMK